MSREFEGKREAERKHFEGTCVCARVHVCMPLIPYHTISMSSRYRLKLLVQLLPSCNFVLACSVDVVFPLPLLNWWPAILYNACPCPRLACYDSTGFVHVPALHLLWFSGPSPPLFLLLMPACCFGADFDQSRGLALVTQHICYFGWALLGI